MPENSKKVFIPLMLLVYSSCIPVVPFQGELSCFWFGEGPSYSFACHPLTSFWTLDSGLWRPWQLEDVKPVPAPEEEKAATKQASQADERQR